MTMTVVAAKDLTSTTMPLPVIATRRTERRLITIVAPNQQPPHRVEVRLSMMSVDSAVGTTVRARREGVITTPPGEVYFFFLGV